MTNGEEMYVNGIQTKLQHSGGKKSRIIKGPNLKSTMNFKTKMLFILSLWTDISHVSKSQENSNLHKPFYSFINSALKYNYRFHSDTWLASNIS